MALNKRLEEAADRLKMASVRIDEIRSRPASQDQMQEWLAALTDYVLAMTELHDLNMETLREDMADFIRRQRRASATV
jgi:hypothetical protein